MIDTDGGIEKLGLNDRYGWSIEEKLGQTLFLSQRKATKWM